MSGPTSDQVAAKSVLDYAMESIAGVQKKLGAQDKARLESYLQNIRDLEVKLTAPENGKVCPGAPAASPPYSGGPLDFATNLNMFADIIALAISSGIMPVASIMTSREADGGPNRWYAGVDYLSSFVGIDGKKVKFSSPGADFHDSTHNSVHYQEAGVKNIEMHIAYSQMNMCFVQRLLQKLNSMPLEPNGMSPLDNSVILVGSCHAHPGDHNTHNLPTLLAGGKKFNMKQGQHIAFPLNTDIGDLYYTIAKAMGVAGSSFNGHSTVLNGVFG
jgi:hypothetical protein